VLSYKPMTSIYCWYEIYPYYVSFYAPSLNMNKRLVFWATIFAHSPGNSSSFPTRCLKRCSDAKPWKLVSLSGKPSIFTPANSRGETQHWPWKLTNSRPKTKQLDLWGVNFWHCKRRPFNDQTARLGPIRIFQDVDWKYRVAYCLKM